MDWTKNKKLPFKMVAWSVVRNEYGEELEEHLVSTLTGHGKMPHEIYPALYDPDEQWFSPPDYRKRVLVNVGSKSSDFDTCTIQRHYRLSGILTEYMCDTYKIYPNSGLCPDPDCMLICSEAMKHKDITQYKLNIKNKENVRISYDAADNATLSAINKCLTDAQECVEAAKRLLGQYEKRRPTIRPKVRRGNQLHSPSA